VVGLAGASLQPVNGMVGSGIFATPALIYAGVGGFAPWMFVAVGALFFPVAWVFAQLARRFDQSGGPQLYVQAAFGPFLGFQAGWTRYASSAAAAAGNLHVMVSYLAALFPGLEGPVARPVTVLAILWTIMLVNVSGMRRAVGALAGVSAFKFLPILVLIVAGFVLSPPEFRFALPEFSAAESVVLLVFYTFMGFEGLVMSAGEVKSPRRTIPKVLLVSIAGTALLYMLVVWAYIGVDPAGAAGDAMPLASMAATLAGPWAATAIAATAAMSICANTLETGINTSRLSYAMAVNGLLPRVLAHVSPRFRTPDASILLLGTVSSLFALSGAFAFLAVASTVSRIVMYLLCAAALPTLRRREVSRGESRWNVLDFAMPLLAIVACLWVARQAETAAFGVLALIIAAGALLYLIARRRPRTVEPEAAV
jgi:amino acid transporter